MVASAYDTLFICSGNSARSIFAEALLRDLGGERFKAYSAGVDPASELNPRAVELLRRNGHDVAGLRSKHVSTFQGEDAPRMDFVFTVCDRAAAEECMPWPGQAMTADWGVDDPVKATGSDAEVGLAFANAYKALRRRVEAFVALPMESLDRVAIQPKLDAIADMKDE